MFLVPVTTLSLGIDLKACSCSWEHEYEHLYASSALEHSTVSTGFTACIRASTMMLVCTSMTTTQPISPAEPGTGFPLPKSV